MNVTLWFTRAENERLYVPSAFDVVRHVGVAVSKRTQTFAASVPSAFFTVPRPSATNGVPVGVGGGVAVRTGVGVGDGVRAGVGVGGVAVRAGVAATVGTTVGTSVGEAVGDGVSVGAGSGAGSTSGACGSIARASASVSASIARALRAAAAFPVASRRAASAWR